MLTLVRFWILLSTLLVAGGWILSALRQLNRAGYAVIFALLALVILVWWQNNETSLREKMIRFRRKFRKRFSRRLPQLFLLIAALAFLSGCLYPALNFDANAYRLPRVMHWLWAGQWHWIHTFDARLNISACGMEWLSAPLILFTHNDRTLFLINWISYLMLPGLVFSVLTRLQVRPRVAWWWAWLLSSGWCFALQAGSIANDSFAAIYILAAVDLALRARQNKSLTDLWLSLLAAALVTDTKQTNIPLAALWLIAVWPVLPLLWKNPLRSGVVVAAGLLISIVPISVANLWHTGSWLPVGNAGIARLGEFNLNPFWGIVGNLFCIPIQNLVPPFYELIPPFYSYWLSAWNELMTHFLQTSFGAHFRSFENFGHLSGVYYHGISEGNAGLGLGIGVLWLAAFRIHRRCKMNLPTAVEVSRDKILLLLRVAPWALLLLFMAKVGTFENARHLAPYYVFLFPILLIHPVWSLVVRHRKWQRLAIVVMGFTVALIFASGDRPLFPAKTVFSALRAKFPDNEFIAEECSRYLDGGYAITLAQRDFLQTALPHGETKIGYYALMYDVDEPGIWLPFGRRSVVEILPDDSPARLRAEGIKYLVTYGKVLPQQNLNRWLKEYDATVVSQYTFPRPGTRTTAADLYLIRLN